MPRPIDGQLKADILRDIRDTRDEPDPGKRLTRNAIARRRGVSPGTVTNLAAANGLADAFDRTNTVKGARARQFDAAFARAVLIERYYVEAGKVLDRVSTPYTQVILGRGGPEFVTTRLPPLRDAQAGMSASAIAVDKAAKLEDRQGDGRVDAAKSLLGGLLAGLQAVYGDSPDGSGG